MLSTTLNLYETLSGHVTAINLQHTNKVCLTNLAFFSDISDVFTDSKILFNFLFHKNHPDWT